jgi:hypothetical protein
MPTEAIGLVLDGNSWRSAKLSSASIFKWIIALQRRAVERLAMLYGTKRVSA